MPQAVYRLVGIMATGGNLTCNERRQDIGRRQGILKRIEDELLGSFWRECAMPILFVVHQWFSDLDSAGDGPSVLLVLEQTAML